LKNARGGIFIFQDFVISIWWKDSFSLSLPGSALGASSGVI